jgi:hypothetical protein
MSNFNDTMIARTRKQSSLPRVSKGFYMTVNITSAIIGSTSDLDAARISVKASAVKTGEVITNYARLIAKYLDLTNDEGVTTKWYDRKGKLGADVTAERDKFKALFPEAAKNETPKAGEFAYGTGDVYWGRVKQADGYQTAAQKKAASEAKTDTIVDMCRKELATMLNRINKARGTKPEGLDLMLEVYEDLEVVFATLGGNPDTDLK